MNRKPCTPNFNTPPEKFSKEELNKIAAGSIAGNLRADFADLSRDDIAWETEALAKSHGIYLEFNRDKEAVGNKEWIYMLRISIPVAGLCPGSNIILSMTLVKNIPRTPMATP